MNRQSVHTADVIAILGDKFVIVQRLKSPLGLALPGGHVDPGERPRQAAIREFTEETGLHLSNVQFVMRRRGKKRDPRYAMSETRVFSGLASGVIKDEKGHTKVVLLSKNELLKLPKERFAFDHWEILVKYLHNS